MVDHFSEVLTKMGYKSVVTRMEDHRDIEPDENSTLGLFFPVAIQSTFPLVWDFVKNLPEGKNRDVFMLDTMESFSGGIVGPMKKVLTKKGYTCIGAREFKMSSSMNTSPDKFLKGKTKNSIALEKVEQFAVDLAKGNTSWKRIPFLSDMMKSMSNSRKIWTWMSKSITVSDQCIRCLICQNNCPVNAIDLVSGKITIDHSKCISCMRCLSKCPKGAIKLHNKELHLP